MSVNHRSRSFFEGLPLSLCRREAALPDWAKSHSWGYFLKLIVSLNVDSGDCWDYYSNNNQLKHLGDFSRVDGTFSLQISGDPVCLRQCAGHIGCTVCHILCIANVFLHCQYLIYSLVIIGNA